MELDIRKLRKKLRQIETLERLDRNLNKDESEKVSRKEIIRTELFQLLEQCTDGATPIALQFGNGIEFIAGILPDNEKYLNCDSAKVIEEFDKLAMKRISKPESKDSHKTVPKKKRKQESEVISSGVLSSQSTSHSLPSQPLIQESCATELSEQDEEHSQNWGKIKFVVRSLQGHNDLITCAAIDGNLLVTGSRDTTIKIWNAETGSEELSLRGHTGTITCLVLLNNEYSKFVTSCNPDEKVIISGSHDCYIKTWTTAGKSLRSMYTYNTVSSIGYISSQNLIIAGSEAGKLELWDPTSGLNIFSIKAYDDPISCLKIHDDEIVTAGGDGTIKIWLTHLRNLELIAESCFIKNAFKLLLAHRYIRSLAITKNKIYFGDDGPNIKIWSLNQNTLYKLSNHVGEFGTTDAMCTINGFLLSSSYNLDTGNSVINVRNLSHDHYLASFSDGNTQRIMTVVAATQESGLLKIITVGQELKIWDMIKKNDMPIFDENDSRTVVDPYIEHAFLNAAVDSDVQSDDSRSESDDEINALISNDENIYLTNQNSFWQRWCSIL